MLRVNHSKLRQENMHGTMWLLLKNITSHLIFLPLCRVSGWSRRASGQWINFPIRVRLKFTGLFLAVSGGMLWSCLARLRSVGYMQSARTPN